MSDHLDTGAAMETTPITQETHISASLVFQLVAIVSACLLTYAAVASRVAVVESQQIELRKQLEQIDVSLRGINQNIYELLKLEAASHTRGDR